MDHSERKLELLNSIRREQDENIYRLQRREKILYPKQDVSYQSHNHINDFQNDSNLRNKGNSNFPQNSFKKNYQISKKNSFIFRLFLAAFLFLIYLYMDEHKLTFYEYSSNDFQNHIAEDLELKSFAFMEQFSYTLKD